MSQPWEDHAVPTPAAVQQFLDWAAVQMALVSPEHEQALEELGEAQDRWDGIYDPYIAGLRHSYDAGDRKWPGEDVRLSLCRQEVDGAADAWRALRDAQARVRSVEKRSTQLQTAISARQSTLRMMREEAGMG